MIANHTNKQAVIVKSRLAMPDYFTYVDPRGPRVKIRRFSYAPIRDQGAIYHVNESRPMIPSLFAQFRTSRKTAPPQEFRRWFAC